MLSLLFLFPLTHAHATFGDLPSSRRGGTIHFPQREVSARAFFNSRTMEKRFNATRREGVETPMYAAPARRATGPHSNSCTHGLASRTKVRASQAVPQTT